MASNPDVPPPSTAATELSPPQSHPPGSSSRSLSSSSIRAVVSPDSDDESPLKYNENSNSSSISSSSISSSARSDSSEAGFVSGVEDFEGLPESDRPFVGQRDEVVPDMTAWEGEEEEDEDEDVESFIEACDSSREFSAIPMAGMPMAKVSADEDDDVVVEGEGFETVEGVLGENDGDGSLLNSKLNEGVSVTSDVEVNSGVGMKGDVLEEPNMPSDPASAGKQELSMEAVEEKVVMGDSADDITGVDSLNQDKVVGGIEEASDSETLQREVPVNVDENIPLDDVHGHIGDAVKEPVGSDFEPNDAAITASKGEFMMGVEPPSEAVGDRAVLGVNLLNQGTLIDSENLLGELPDKDVHLAKGHKNCRNDAEAVEVDTKPKPVDATSANKGDFVMGVEHSLEAIEGKAVLGDSVLDIEGVATLDQATVVAGSGKNNDFETLQELPVVESIQWANRCEHIIDDAEDSVDAESFGVDSKSKNIVESGGNFDVGIAAPEPLKEKTDVSYVSKTDENIGIEVVKEDNQASATMESKTNGGPETSNNVETTTPEPLQKKSDDSDVVKAGETIGIEVVEEDNQGNATLESKTNGGPETSINVETAAPEPLQKKSDASDVVKADETIGMESVEEVIRGGGTMDSSCDSSKVRAQGDDLEVGVSHNEDSSESAKLSSMLNKELTMEVEDEANQDPDDGDTEGSNGDGETEGMIFESSEAAKQFLKELGQGMGTGSQLSTESSFNHAQRVDGQIVTDSDEEVDTDEGEDGKELFDSNALAALLKAATNAGPDDARAALTSQDGSRMFSIERPAGLGSSLRALRPSPQQPRRTFVSGLETEGDSEDNLTDEERKRLEKLQQTRVKFLRLVQRLGYSPEDSMAQQVLYRLALTIRRDTSQAFTFDAAKRKAAQLEAEGKNDLSFSLNILAIGKSGVGKSATINSIFGEELAVIDAFEPTTTVVKEIVGVVGGVKIRVFDTPGLRSSAMEQGFNNKVLSSIKKHTKKCPPDIVLYVDRLDSQTRDLNDLPLLRSITNSLGASIWKNSIVTYTHAGSAPPDGPSGSPMSYEVFVAQRSNVVQQSIAQAIGDLRLMNPTMVNPVTLVENHPSCRKNREGQKVLPNGQTWQPQLLLLSYSLKILSEVSDLSKHDSFDHRKIFGFRVRPLHLPYLLSWLLQSRTHPKLSGDLGGEIGDSDMDLDDMSDSEPEDEEDEYDQLPPFKPMRKSQIAKLSHEQRKAYLEEYDYRVKLLQKKQWRQELRRMKEIKKKGKVASDDHGDDFDQDTEGPAGVHVPLPDFVLPASFDSDSPSYRYRFLEPTSQFLARPVLDTHGWDHDCGYDGVNLEYSQAIVGRFPATVVAQISKDKNEFTLHLDSSIAAKHGDKGSSVAGFDIQNIGKQLAYILRGETKLKSWRKNKTTAGVSVTFVGENVVPGAKIENHITIGKRLVLVGSTGTVRHQGDVAYGANLEMRLREADFPIGQDQSTLGLSLVKWRGDLSLLANLQSQFSIRRSLKMAVRGSLNNKMSGHITIRTSSSDQLHIGLIGILPIFKALCKNIWPGDTEDYLIH